MFSMFVSLAVRDVDDDDDNDDDSLTIIGVIISCYYIDVWI